MRRNKKLQVFVSSTFTDLKTERQAAVEAILTAGHIPAGMELFSAGDESQMSVIKRWIDESDVYLLILGGRYGSLEPLTQKSYTHLEYEYALDQGKPLFGVVIKDSHLDEKVKQFGREVFETSQPQKLKEFRDFVCSKMVRFWDDPRDIKIAILETMDEFSRRDDLIGWIPGSEAVDTASLAAEIARLSSENAALHERLEAKSTVQEPEYSGLSFQEMCDELTSVRSDVSAPAITSNLTDTARLFGDGDVGLLHFLWVFSDWFLRSKPFGLLVTNASSELSQLMGFGLINTRGQTIYDVTETGRGFLMRMRSNHSDPKERAFILSVNMRL